MVIITGNECSVRVTPGMKKKIAAGNSPSIRVKR